MWYFAFATVSYCLLNSYQTRRRCTRSVPFECSLVSLENPDWSPHDNNCWQNSYVGGSWYCRLRNSTSLWKRRDQALPSILSHLCLNSRFPLPSKFISIMWFPCLLLGSSSSSWVTATFLALATGETVSVLGSFRSPPPQESCSNKSRKNQRSIDSTLIGFCLVMMSSLKWI